MLIFHLLSSIILMHLKQTFPMFQIKCKYPIIHGPIFPCINSLTMFTVILKQSFVPISIAIGSYSLLQIASFIFSLSIINMIDIINEYAFIFLRMKPAIP